ncbi:MAG: heme exporter protein CcmB, partial [Alphaproteobacteria bacterium]|nr:heme exporter protein CcmB [Alphaproteobacteria bacterium]
MSDAFLAVLKRDLALAWRQGGTGAMTVGFFLIVVTLFPFGIGPEREVLARIAAGLLWVAALLAALLSLDRLFQADQEDGSLDQLMIAVQPAEILVLAKVAAHWLAAGLPLVIAAPLLAVLIALPEEAIPTLLLSLLLGTPILSLIGAI